jgi:hypothetical protein
MVDFNNLFWYSGDQLFVEESFGMRTREFVDLLSKRGDLLMMV